MLPFLLAIATQTVSAAPVIESAQSTPLRERGSCRSVQGDVHFPSNHPGDYETPCWGAVLQTDSMTDRKSCQVSPADTSGVRPTIRFFFGHPVEFLLVTGGDGVYPGSTTHARVDKKPALSGEEGVRGSALRSLIADIQGGEVLTIRYTPWPSGAPKEGSYKLAGAAEAISWCQVQLKQ